MDNNHEEITQKADDGSYDSARVVKDSWIKLCVSATFSAHQHKADEHGDDGNSQKIEIDG